MFTIIDPSAGVPDGSTVLAATTSTAATFALPVAALSSAGAYSVIVDPGGPAVGTMKIAITESRER